MARPDFDNNQQASWFDCDVTVRQTVVSLSRNPHSSLHPLTKMKLNVCAQEYALSRTLISNTELVNQNKCIVVNNKAKYLFEWTPKLLLSRYTHVSRE